MPTGTAVVDSGSRLAGCVPGPGGTVRDGFMPQPLGCESRRRFFRVLTNKVNDDMSQIQDQNHAPGTGRIGG